VGRINVLEQLGRYDEAIALADALQRELGGDASDEALALIAKSRLNLGVCYLAIGRPERALEAYAQAESLFQRLGDAEGAAQVMNNQGVVLLEMGRTQEAVAMFERAAPIFAAHGLDLEVAHTYQNIGYTCLVEGRYSAGFAAFERARAILWPLEASADKGALLLDLGDAYLDLNLYAEAEITYREAIAAMQSSAMAYEHGRAWQGLGTALRGLGRVRDAEDALAQAAHVFRVAGNALALSGVVLQQATLLAADGQRSQALARAEEALSLAQASPLQRSQVQAMLAQLSLPDAEAALAHLRAAEAIAEQLRVPRVQQRVLGLLGRAHALRGENAAAEDYLWRAIRLLESQRMEITHERMRASFVGDKLDPFDDLIVLLLQEGARDPHRVRQAFELTERARSRALVDRMVSDPTPAGATADAQLLAEQRALHVKLAAAYSVMFAGEATEADAVARNEAQVIALEQALSRLQLQMHADDSLGAGAPMSLEAICAALTAGDSDPSRTALLSYYLLGERIVAFVVLPEDASNVRVVHVGPIAVVRDALEQLGLHNERIANDPALARRHAATLERSARKTLATLYDALIRPVEQVCPDARRPRGARPWRTRARESRGAPHMAP
ncbi:tetratricopeptide repeat protein, partial [Candidatus Roseilinea sp. NK_OTU-006]|uniref:tetratricopeptide repeat protein n=1 Tax=Candidatus Roseilinea sp. NK_OTU-006 TaxID=2704250 RepID=UPI00145CAE88